MSEERPARAAGPPGRPVLPLEAELEIMDTLSANMRISADHKRYGISPLAAIKFFSDGLRKRKVKN